MSSDDSDTSLNNVPLPPSPPPEDDNDIGIISPSKIPIPDDIDFPPGTSPHQLDEIPIPMEIGTSKRGIEEDEEIPLPPDSSKYSPSQATGDDEVMMSPSESYEPVVSSTGDTVSSTSKKSVTKVLDKAQAKKRLMAFSAAKMQAVTSSSMKKSSPVKGVSVFAPSKDKKHDHSHPLAIESIKQEETKMKEILAVNKLLSDKLKQVNSITNDIPKAPPITAVVNPTVMSLTDSKGVSSDHEESSPATITTMTTMMKPPSSSSSRHLRRRSGSNSPSPPRSHSPSRDSSKRSRDREGDIRRTSGSRKASSRRSRSRSKSKSPAPKLRKSRRSRSRSKSPISRKSSSKRVSKSRSKSPRRSSKRPKSRSKSPKKVSINKSRSHSRSQSKDVSKKSKSSSKRSKSRSKSPTTKKSSSRRSRSRSKSPVVKKLSTRRSESRSPKRSKDKKKCRRSSRSPSPSKEKESARRKQRDESRERRKEKERGERERERKEVEKREAEERALIAELDKIRKIRMPVDWTEYFKYQYSPDHIRVLWSQMTAGRTRARSRSRSSSKSPVRSKDIDSAVNLPSVLSKALEKPLKTAGVIQINLNNGEKGEYPVFLVQKTSSSPIVSYGVNPLTFSGYYKTRKQVFKVEEPEIALAMSEIIKASEVSTPQDVLPSLDKSKREQEWFAQNDQIFCPSEGSKGILISHLYSDEEMDDSPLPGGAAGISTKQKYMSPVKKASSDGNKSPEEESEEPEHDSLDSAPSPLLKRKYEDSVPKTVEIVERAKSDVIERRRRGNRSSSDSESHERSLVSSKKPDKGLEKARHHRDEKDILPLKVKEKDRRSGRGKDKDVVKPRALETDSDDEEFLDMEVDEFPLEKDIVAPTIDLMGPQIEKESGKAGKEKSKDKKVKKQKKKKHHKVSKDRKRGKDSSGEEASDSELIVKEMPVLTANVKKPEKEPTILDRDVKSKAKTEREPSKSKKRDKQHHKAKESGESSTISSTAEGTGDEYSRTKKPSKKRPRVSVSEEPIKVVVKDKGDKSESRKGSEKMEKVPEKVDKVIGDLKVEEGKKDKDKKSKRKPHEDKSKSKHKRKHSKKHRAGSTSSASESSDTDESSSLSSPSSSSSSSSEESSDEESRSKSKTKKQRISKKKGSKKEKHKVSKKDKKRDKSTPLSEEEVEDNEDADKSDKKKSRRDKDDKGDRNKDRDGGTGGGSAGGRSRDRSGDRGKERSRDGKSHRDSRGDGDHQRDKSDRKRGGDGGRRRASFEELFASLGENFKCEPKNDDLIHNENDAMVAALMGNLGVKKSIQSLCKTESNLKMTDHLGMGVETNDFLSQFDDDPFLQSVLKNKDLSAEALLKTLSVSDVVLDNKPCTTSQQVGAVSKSSVAVAKGCSNWSDDSEEERKIDKVKLSIANQETVLTPAPSSGYGTEKSSAVDKSSTASSSSSSSDSSGSSSDSSDSSSSSDEDSTDSEKKKEDTASEKNKPDLYDPFEAVMNEIAAVEKSEKAILPKEVLAEMNSEHLHQTIPVVTSGEKVLVISDTVISGTSRNSESIGKDIRNDHVTDRLHTQIAASGPNVRDKKSSSVDHESRHREKDVLPKDSGSRDRERFRRSPSPRYGDGGRVHGHRERRYRDSFDLRYENERFGGRRRRRISRSRSRSRSRSPRSHSRSRSPSPRRGGRFSSRSSSRHELHDVRDRERHHSRDRDSKRYHRDRDYHDRGRFSPEFVLRDGGGLKRRLREDYTDDRNRGKYSDDFMHELGLEMGRKSEYVHDSPPLQLNVADSTISDAELAANHQQGLLHQQHGYGDPGRGDIPMYQFPMPYPPPPIVPDIQQHIQQQVPMGQGEGAIGYDYGSPPRRLSLDERLEMEMGIKLRDGPKKVVEQQSSGYLGPQGPYYPGGQYMPQGGYQNQYPVGKVPPHQLYPSGPSIQHTWPGEIPSSKNAVVQQRNQPRLPTMAAHQQRQQCQILQLGNVIQVMPTEIPNGSFTISASVEVTHNSKSEKGKPTQPPIAKRVVTIKVPVRPFVMPVVLPPPVREQEVLQEVSMPKKKRDKSKKRRHSSSTSVANKKSHISVKIVEEVDCKKLTKEQEPNAASEEEEVTAEELELLKEAITEVPVDSHETEQEQALGTQETVESQIVDDIETDDTAVEGKQPEIKPEMQGKVDNVEMTEEKIRSDADADAISIAAVKPGSVADGETKTVMAIVPEVEDIPQWADTWTKITLPLPAAGRGILVAVGFRDKDQDRNGKPRKKGVKFMDGINPGYGTESSDGEEMRSPPPPSQHVTVSHNPEPIVLVKSKQKIKKKRRVKVKDPKHSKDIKHPVIIDPSPNDPPPPPSDPYPYCPPGLLYQVCPQYAIMIAQVLAEKGFDIVFAESHQLPATAENISVDLDSPLDRDREEGSSRRSSEQSDSGKTRKKDNSDKTDNYKSYRDRDRDRSDRSRRSHSYSYAYRSKTGARI